MQIWSGRNLWQASVQMVSFGTKSTIRSARLMLTIWYSFERRCISMRCASSL